MALPPWSRPVRRPIDEGLGNDYVPDPDRLIHDQHTDMQTQAGQEESTIVSVAGPDDTAPSRRIHEVGGIPLGDFDTSAVAVEVRFYEDSGDADGDYIDRSGATLDRLPIRFTPPVPLLASEGTTSTTVGMAKLFTINNLGTTADVRAYVRYSDP